MSSNAVSSLTVHSASATFLNHVPSIYFSISKKQMVRFHALRVIAAVINICFWRDEAKRQFKAVPMCEHRFIADRKRAVALRYFCAKPEPAIIGLLYLGPEARFFVYLYFLGGL